MRSSKSRSRNKNNRNRPQGNVVNRVFDSSGPEGKVRGTPQQIIDKYNQLARDAQLANDRVATENFQQHAEHYTRMLAEAQREQAERQAQQQGNQQNNNNNNQQNGNQQGGNPQNSGQQGGDGPTNEQPRAEQRGDAGDRRNGAPKDSGPRGDDTRASDVIDVASDNDSGLVETPEEKPARQRRSRRKPAAEATTDTTPDPAAS